MSANERAISPGRGAISGGVEEELAEARVELGGRRINLQRGNHSRAQSDLGDDTEALLAIATIAA